MRIMVAIERLPEREREVAVRNLLNGQPLSDVVKEMGLTKGVVGNLRRNVIRRLRQALADLQE